MKENKLNIKHTDRDYGTERDYLYFKESFNEQLNDSHEDDENYFYEELKRVQIMAMNGKINPMHKQIIEQWRDLHPDRFSLFCNQLSDENRMKIFHFLQLDDE